jgi:hypothetical protein
MSDGIVIATLDPAARERHLILAVVLIGVFEHDLRALDFGSVVLKDRRGHGSRSI